MADRADLGRRRLLGTLGAGALAMLDPGHAHGEPSVIPYHGGRISPPVPIRAPLGLQRAFTTVDFTAGVETDRWSLELSLLNAFDERADLYRFAPCTVQRCSGEPYIATNRPRTVGLRFGMKFE